MDETKLKSLAKLQCNNNDQIEVEAVLHKPFIESHFIHCLEDILFEQHEKGLKVNDEIELSECSPAIINKQDLEHQQRIISNYFKDKKQLTIPKLIRVDNTQQKLEEIASIKDSSIQELGLYFYDNYPCLNLRRRFFVWSSKLSKLSSLIVRHPVFENMILIAIILNTAFILISDPRSDSTIQDKSDNYFLLIYSIECILKIVADGFVQNEGAYLKDNWNILDFIVVVVGWFTLIVSVLLGNIGIGGLGILRTIRTLRPLKSIKSISGLRIILETLFDSMSGIKDTIIVLFFFFMLFAVAGLQMWQGNFLQRCVNIETGNAVSYDSYKSACTADSDCLDFNQDSSSYYCLKININPYNNAISFDNIVNSFLIVFIASTKVGWSEYFNYLERTFQDSLHINELVLFVYFHLLIFIGDYYLINLFLAVINETFQKIDQRNRELAKPKAKRLIELFIRKFKDDKLGLANRIGHVEFIDYNPINKDMSIVPLDYQTFKDMYLLKSNTPKELYIMTHDIMKEAQLITEEMKTRKNDEPKKPKQVTLKSFLTQKEKVDILIKKSIKNHSRKNLNNLDAFKLNNKALKNGVTDALQTFTFYMRSRIEKNKKIIPMSKKESRKTVLPKSDKDSFNSEVTCQKRIQTQSPVIEGCFEFTPRKGVKNQSCFNGLGMLNPSDISLEFKHNEELKNHANDERIDTVWLYTEGDEQKELIDPNSLLDKIRTGNDIVDSDDNLDLANNNKINSTKRAKVNLRSGFTYKSKSGKVSSSTDLVRFQSLKSKDKRRKSITNLELKYPASPLDYYDDEVIDESVEHESDVRRSMRCFRENCAYTVNLLNKDISINDKFDVNSTYTTDILRNMKLNDGIYQISDNSEISTFNSKLEVPIELQPLYYTWKNEEQLQTKLNHKLNLLNPRSLAAMPAHNLEFESTTNLRNVKINLRMFHRSSVIDENHKRRSSFEIYFFDKSKKFSSIPLGTAVKEEVNFIDNVDYHKLSNSFLKDKPTKPKVKSSPNARLVSYTVKTEISRIKNHDKESNIKKYTVWSKNDVLMPEDDYNIYEKWNQEINDLYYLKVNIFTGNELLRPFKLAKLFFFKMAYSMILDTLIVFFVILNAFVMSLDGNLLLPEDYAFIDILNLVFNSIFITEFLIKIIGMGPVLFFSEVFSYLDLAIIAFALLDLFVIQSEIGFDVNQLAFIRVFRIFRVLRLMKVLRKVKSVRKIVAGITKSIAPIIYFLLILLIFIIVFQLIGTSLFNKDDNYSSFILSFYATFQIMTIENWSNNLVELSKISRFTVVYLIIWIIIGNFVLFNLFLSILLESFVEEPYLGYIYPKEYPETFKEASLKEKMAEFKNLSKQSELQDDEDEHSDSDGEDCDLSDKLINQYLSKNECERSLYYFSQQNNLRRKLILIINHRVFDNLIIFIIFCSTITLISETFITNENYNLLFIFETIDLVFNFIFIFECSTKIISLGFVMDSGSYLRDNWNKLDFVIVVVSLFDIEQLLFKRISVNDQNQMNIGFLKVLRILRILRPLRFISHNIQLKLMINCLFDSIQAIINVIFIVLVVLFIMSVVGISLFSSEISSNCYEDKEHIVPDFESRMTSRNISQVTDPIHYLNECYKLGGSPDFIPDFLFSNIFESMLTSYVLSSCEGWTEIRDSYIRYFDVYGLYFVFFLLIVSYFFMNLFVGVMFSAYNDAIKKEKMKGIQDDIKAQRYLDYLFLLKTAKPHFITYRKSNSNISKKVSKITSSTFFDNFIISVIVMNMITLAIDYEGSSPSYSSTLMKFNYFFTSIFIIELILKLIAMSPQAYFNRGWNKFDSFVVIASIFDIIISNSFSNTNIKFLKSFQIIRVLRVLRVTRILRLFKSLKGLEKILQTVYWSIRGLSNVLILLILVIFIFAILGCNMVSFYYSNFSSSFLFYDAYFNFDNFYRGFLLVFRSVSGENWPAVMKELANVFDEQNIDPVIVYLFMVGMNFFISVIMVNLFMLVVLEQYNEFNSRSVNPFISFNELLDEFNSSWNLYSNDNEKGQAINSKNMLDFVMGLSHPEMSFNQVKGNIQELKRYLSDLKLLVDAEGRVHFLDVLYKLIKKEFGLNDRKIKVVINEEQKIIKRIQNQIKSNSFSQPSMMDQGLSYFNPITPHLYYSTSFSYICQFIKSYKKEDDDKKNIREGVVHFI